GGAILVAFAPVDRDRLDRFAELTGLPVTTGNARRIIGHFTRLRRWRLIAFLPAVPLAVVTDDPFYLVLGWCAAALLAQVDTPASGQEIYRTVWQLGLTAAVVICGYLLLNQDVTPAAQIHVLALIIVAASVRFLTRESAPSPDDETERAIAHWTTRSLYLSATAIVLSAAVLTPGQAS